jgi:hypothetical protein
MRWFSKNEMVIPIASPKRDEVAYEQAFVTIRRKLREGWIVGIFPEGKLTSDGEMAEFRRGIEKILERDAVPVIPVALNGLWGSWFSRKGGAAMKKRPGRLWSRVYVTVGDPVPPEKVTADELHARVKALADQMPDRP